MKLNNTEESLKMRINTSNRVVRNAILAMNRGAFDDAMMMPRDKWELLDDLENILTVPNPSRRHLNIIKKAAEIYGCLDEVKRECAKAGVRI